MNTNFIIFGLTRPGIETEFTVSVADALSTRPLINAYFLLANLLVFLFENLVPSKLSSDAFKFFPLLDSAHCFAFTNKIKRFAILFVPCCHVTKW